MPLSPAEKPSPEKRSFGEPRIIGQLLDAEHPRMAFALSTLWILRPVFVIGAMTVGCMLAPEIASLIRLWR